MVCFYGLALFVVALLLAITLDAAPEPRPSLRAVSSAWWGPTSSSVVLPARPLSRPAAPRSGAPASPVQEIRSVARAVHQVEPTEVYLIP
jgi:hypothetical protein